MFYPMINKETNKVIGFQPSTAQIVEVDMDELPAANPKPGVDHVMYYDKKSKKIILKEEPRELTDQEKLLKELASIKQATTDNTTAIAEIIGNEIGATAEGGETV